MLLVGLGNPGTKYAHTRHNVGFMLVDTLLETLGELKCSSSFSALLYKAPPHYLLKPLTYMNRSGESLKEALEYLKIDPSEVVVVHDDLDLPFGALRFKRGGGSGGHNGLKSIDNAIGREYLRVRLGIGRPANKEEVASYVLSPFSKEEQESLVKLLQKAKEATLALLEGKSLEQVASQYGIKKVKS